MKKIIFLILFICLTSFTFSDVNGQMLSSGRRGIGINIGSQIMNGDAGYVGFGGAFEGYVKYVLNPRIFAVGTLGYGELSDGTLVFGESSYSTDMIHLDLKGGFNLLQSGRFQPYGYGGFGAIWFRLNEEQRGYTGLNGHYFGGYFTPAVFFGGGFEYKISPKLSFVANADYRVTFSDDIDPTNHNIDGDANDHYLSLRSGVTLYMEPERFGTGKEIEVAEKTPIEELDFAESGGFGEAGEAGSEDELSALIEGIDQYGEKSESDFAMGEYIQLKSRVDNLNDAISQKELEIEELKSQLENRKDRISELETSLSGRSGALASSINADVSDFTASYEQALENFYSREFDAAIYIFNMLLETSPNHKLASNCQYWIGECYFGKNEYTNAIEAFEKVLAYEQSFKKDDALIMLGRSYIKTGDVQLAAQMFDELMNSYPDSEYYEKAQRYASSM